MFELYRDAGEGLLLPPEDGEGEAPAAEGAKWRWQLTSGDKVLARSEETWAKRSAALAAVNRLRGIVAAAGVVEKLV